MEFRHLRCFLVVAEELHFVRAAERLHIEQSPLSRASAFKAACYQRRVTVIDVNPAYTSVIGAVNHAQTGGWSIHQGAAFAIARRGMKCGERLAVRDKASVPTRNGGHVTFELSYCYAMPALKQLAKPKVDCKQWAAMFFTGLSATGCRAKMNCRPAD